MKTFVRTSNALRMSTHAPLDCAGGGGCRRVTLLAKEALLFHYREDCVKDIKVKQCKRLTEQWMTDYTLWRWKEKIDVGMRNTLRNLSING